MYDSHVSVTLLPDTRARDPKGRVWTRRFGWMVKVHCGNCRRPHGMVPEKGMTFAFVLCKRCEAFGDTSKFAFAEPDEVYWERMRLEVEEARQRADSLRGTLDPEFDPVAWIKAQLADPSSPVSLIARDIEERLRKAS